MFYARTRFETEPQGYSDMGYFHDAKPPDKNPTGLIYIFDIGLEIACNSG